MTALVRGDARLLLARDLPERPGLQVGVQAWLLPLDYLLR